MNSIPPGDLYKNPEIREHALRWREFWRDGFSLDEITVPLDQAVKQEGLPRYLDSLGRKFNSWDPEVKGAALALSCLPYQEIIKNYDEEVLVWALANTDVRERCDYLYNDMSQEDNHDIDFLKKAINLNRDWDRVARVDEVQADYDLMRNISDESLSTIDLESTLASAARPGVRLSDKRIQDYSLFPLRLEPGLNRTAGHAQDWRSKIINMGLYSIYLDLPIGVGISYKDIPQAVTTFRNWGDSELLICQIQGVRGHKLDEDAYKDRQELSITGELTSARGLAPFDWKKLLVGICTKIAEMNNKDTVGIHTLGGSRWLSGEKGRLAYDVPAQAMGFERRNDNHWHLPLRKLVATK